MNKGIKQIQFDYNEMVITIVHNTGIEAYHRHTAKRKALLLSLTQGKGWNVSVFGGNKIVTRP